MLLSSRTRIITIHILIGAFISVVLLHPITKIVYWIEFYDDLHLKNYGNIWAFFIDRFSSSFSQEMITMSLVFSLIGGVLASFLPFIIFLW